MSGKGVPMQNCVFTYFINLAVICISADVFPIRISVLLWSSKLTAPRTRMTPLNYFLRDGQKSTCLISAIGCWVEGKNSVHESACKGSHVWYPRASGFCYRASDFCSLLAQRASAVFWGNSNYRRIVINPANQKGFGSLLKWLVG